jgi:hypothetical protein
VNLTRERICSGTMKLPAFAYSSTETVRVLSRAASRDHIGVLPILTKR